MYLELQVEQQARTRKNIRQSPLLPYPYRGHRRWLLRPKKTIIFAINRTWRIFKIETKVLSKTKRKGLRATQIKFVFNPIKHWYSSSSYGAAG